MPDPNHLCNHLVFVSRARSTIVTEANVQGAPDLTVEILSDATRKKDELTKRKLYERFDVQEYWIVDPDLESVKVFRKKNEAFLRAAELSKETDDILTTPLIPNLRIPLTEIFD